MEILSDSLLAELGRMIRHASRTDHETRYLHRLHCVMLAAKLGSCTAAAEAVGVSARSIERWVLRCRDAPIQDLLDRQHPGRPTALNAEQRAILGVALRGLCDQHLARGEAVRVTRDFVARKFGKCLSLRQCQRLAAELRQINRANGAHAASCAGPQQAARARAG